MLTAQDYEAEKKSWDEDSSKTGTSRWEAEDELKRYGEVKLQRLRV